jgi:phospholipase C
VAREVARREFLGTLAAVGALAACSSSKAVRSSGTTATKGGRPQTLPKPADAPFDTVVLLMMENRSFDHFLGWLPGADGKQAGLQYPDRNGTLRATHALAPDFQGCASHDPRHDWRSVKAQLNHGKCDGWLRTQALGDTFPIGYYTADDLPITAALARGHTVCDQYHCSVLGPTGPNRMYAWSATTDYLEFNGIMNGQGARPSHLQLSIFDRLHDAGVSAAYFAGKEPQSYAYASKKYDSLTRSHADFFAAARQGTLPHVAYIDPDLDSVAEFIGTATDDHPYGDVRSGESWIRDVYQAIATSPQWDRTVLVITFDEHGGFFDHVVPPRVADDTKLAGPGPDLGQLGFRVPCVVAGPFAPARVEHAGPFEHCSVLRMIEWRWNLPPMTARDRGARNLAEALDLSSRARPVTLPALAGLSESPCPAADNAMHARS